MATIEKRISDAGAVTFRVKVRVKGVPTQNASPMRKVTKPREPRGRVRFLADDERNRLLFACDASACRELKQIVVLALSTGMRLGEILNLSWDDVDLNKRFLILHETKNGERRRVALAGRAFDGLRDMSKVPLLHLQC
jgi:integrase